MNIQQARELLLSLNEKIDKNKPVDIQIAQLFEPWKNSVVPANSLWGRLVAACQPNVLERRKRVKAVFVKAIETLQKESVPGVSRSFCVKLGHALGITQAKDAKLKFNAKSSVDIEKVETMTQEALKKHQSELEAKKKKDEVEAISPLSLLRTALPNTAPSYTLDTFKALFDSSKDHLSDLENYLKRHPQYACKAIHARLPLLQQGKESIEKLTAPILASGANRQKTIHSAAIELAKQIHGIKRGHRMLHCGSYGKPKPPLEIIRKILSHVPREMLKEFPKAFVDFIRNDNTPLSSDALFKKLGDLLRQQMPEISKTLNEDLISCFLPNDARKLSTDGMMQYVPQPLRSGIESWVKQGGIGALTEFCDDGGVYFEAIDD